MHCMDGDDYSVFSILPPYNDLVAQLVDRRTHERVTQGVTLTYESIADPAGSINTYSAGKTNFWDFVQPLFGKALQPDVGLTGNPAPSRTPAPLAYDAQNDWFTADGIPLTPYDDNGGLNFYPMVRVVARDDQGNELARADVVLPVSNEMNCAACHSSVQSGSAAQTAARPQAGWVFDANPERDWKRNILRLHDERHLGEQKFRDALAANGLDPNGLSASVAAGHPVLCASCHGSNALPGTGIDGIPKLTSALHRTHADVINPRSGMALNDARDRGACYLCHPGATTQCLRGAMGKATDAAGNALMSCQSCHGSMAAVGNPLRQGWFDEPNCQACHHDGKRELAATDASGVLKQWSDTRFATNPDTPMPGVSLYRFSKGHGGLKCEACHGATHAIYPTSHENDNILAVSLQGHAGTIAECSVCHESVPQTDHGGPHGMHTIGQDWVKGHEHYAEKNRQSCAYCHGADYQGSPLAQIKVQKTFSIEHGAITYGPGDLVTCYDCHDGPSGKNVFVRERTLVAKHHIDELRDRSPQQALTSLAALLGEYNRRVQAEAQQRP